MMLVGIFHKDGLMVFYLTTQLKKEMLLPCNYDNVKSQ